MKTRNKYLIVTFFALITETSCDNDKKTEGVDLAVWTTMHFFKMFDQCATSPMPNQQFLVDNLKNFVNYPSKTTVGFAPKFSSNRKFFANMITTTEFKQMLAKDEDELRKNIIKKLKYCDEAILDQELLKEFYDREVDQSKI